MIRKQIRKFQQDKRGSAIVMVIVAVAFISILISTLFWVSMANFFMKYSDVKVKESFYTAETVMEEIKAGIQTKASDALMDTYSAALSTYTNGGGEANFHNTYLTSVYDYYDYYIGSEATQKDDGKYEITKLIAYVDSELLSSSRYATQITNPAGKAPELVKSSTTLTLKNVLVKFADYDRDYYAEIETDFVISLPNMSFARAAALPDLFDYALVANDSMVVTGGSVVDLKKNAFGGKNGVTVGSWANGASISVNAPLFVTGGAVTVQGASPQSDFGTGPNTSLYVRDLIVEQGQMNVMGRTYVANDLTFNGKGKVTIGGDYFGYGNSLTNPDESSAVLVNSQNSGAVLDISGINSMLLSGHAFIGTSGSSGYNEGEDVGGRPTISMNKKDVMMDQSVAVKGDQIAYLIPGDCIGVWRFNDGTSETLVGMNPIPEAAYKTDPTEGLVLDLDSYITDACFDENEDGSRGAPNGEMKIVDMDREVYALGNRPLSDFSSEYRLIYRRQNGRPMAYFYVVMQNEEKAREYMAAYMGVRKDQVTNLYNYYLGDYRNVFTDPEESSYSIITPGEYMVNTSEDSGWKLTGGNTSSADQTTTYFALNEVYKALCAKLIERRAELSLTELSKTVYENIVNDDKITDMSESTRIYQWGSGTDTVNAIVSKGNVVLSTCGAGDPDHVKMILSQGDITIDRDFSGLAFAKGKIIVDGGSVSDHLEIDTDRTNLSRVLQSHELRSGSTVEEAPIEFFWDSSQYILEGTSISSNETSQEDQKMDITKLVSYENWTKR